MQCLEEKEGAGVLFVLILVLLVESPAVRIAGRAVGRRRITAAGCSIAVGGGVVANWGTVSWGAVVISRVTATVALLVLVRARREPCRFIFYGLTSAVHVMYLSALQTCLCSYVQVQVPTAAAKTPSNDQGSP